MKLWRETGPNQAPESSIKQSPLRKEGIEPIPSIH